MVANHRTNLNDNQNIINLTRTHMWWGLSIK